MDMHTLDDILDHGILLPSSGTSGPAKYIMQHPEKLAAGNRVAIESQEMTRHSRVYTVCKMQHAAGLLAQTLPAHSIGAAVDIDDFNPYRWLRKIRDYSHTHLTPAHCVAISKTKGFVNVDLRGVWVTCGSDPVDWHIIESFVTRGAVFMANWGMTEIGPIAINMVFRDIDEVLAAQQRSIGGTILGNRYYCDYQIIDNQLFVKGDISVFQDVWYPTGDIVIMNDNHELAYLDRIKKGLGIDD